MSITGCRWPWCSTAYSHLSLVRILHASPDAPPVDVYANGNLIAQNLAYTGFTDYLPIKAGRYRIRIFPAGLTEEPAVDTAVRIPSRFIGTVAAVGLLSEIGLFIAAEEAQSTMPGMAAARFIHLSPDAPNVDIRLPDGTPLFTDVAYKEITEYLPVAPGSYTLDVYPAGVSQLVLRVPGVVLESGKIYSIYAVGLVGGEPPLEALPALDGASYLRFKP